MTFVAISLKLILNSQTLVSIGGGNLTATVFAGDVEHLRQPQSFH